MTGLVITCYERYEYLVQLIESLKRCDMPNYLTILFIDDCSDDNRVGAIAKEISYVIRNERNIGVAASLLKGFDTLFKTCDIVINLDSDAVVRNDFFKAAITFSRKFPGRIITGFDSRTKNKNGSDRHPIVGEGIGYVEKASVGGINFIVDQTAYHKYVRPALVETQHRKGNWDHKASINSMKSGSPIICIEPSVVDHIGFDSAMKHTEEPDTAFNFKPLSLEDVTLIIADCVDLKTAQDAINRTTQFIQFGAVKILTHFESEDERVVNIDKLSSKQEYNYFIVKHLYKYIDTAFVLIVQADGYVRNWKAWSNEFFNYDYIGAKWWYKDKYNVGNGGFSLRSARLQKILAEDENITKTFPEDHQICRTYGRYLTEKYNIKFAPESVADKFSIEGYKQKNVKYSGQFGFHGEIVKFQQEHHEAKTYIINQFQGLGDILFIMPLVRHWQSFGHTIIWPIIAEYLPIQKHFPGITFVEKSLVNINYETRSSYDTGKGSIVLAFRWADFILKLPYTECMKAKYTMFNKDWTMWRQLTWDRDHEAEAELFYNVLGLKDNEKYTLVNRTFRTDKSGKSKINVPGTVVELKSIKGFTLLDWSKVIENATEIHTVGTSINYIIEMLDLKAKEVHLYVRRPEEKDFKNYDYILTKNYIFHG